MREILFRGKCATTGKWVYGAYCDAGDGIGYIVQMQRYIPDTRDWDTAEYYEENPSYSSKEIEADSSTVGEYTGLKDKNGKKIFEGDILLCSVGCDAGETFEVVFYNSCWCVKQPDSSAYTMQDFVPKRWEVVGNIHDNPELIN